MAITSVKIHPAIGVARVGNSPNEFFIGPERAGEHPDPPGGFKDAQCRVKRQAARFRLFAYHDDGTIEELTAVNATISWTVQLANKKAVTRNTGASAADLTINPGSRTLNGPNQRQEFNTGQIKFAGTAAVTVPLGEVRTDDDNHLLVLGGFGRSASPLSTPITDFLSNPNWYDDISDGPVSASVTILGTGASFTAVSAWVLVGPPKFAPHIDNVITLYDRLFQLFVDRGWLTPPPVPSYTKDVFPILQRARDTKAVVNTYAHSWTDPVYGDSSRSAIFSRLNNPSGVGGGMPALSQANLTHTQYQSMEKWKNNNFIRDWTSIPLPEVAITPAGLDRAALEHCVGAAFFPGIEAGGEPTEPILDPAKYLGAAEPFRLNGAVLNPGDMSEFMAIPWQADFHACGSNWWPVPRPNSVKPQGTSTYQSWVRDVASWDEMVTDWHTLGFVVKQGTDQVEVDHCDTTFVTLLTPHINFLDVPQGPGGTMRKTALAINFEVKSTGSPVTLNISPGPAHPRLVPDAVSVTLGPTAGNSIANARFWLVYETGAVGESITDSITVAQATTGRTWTVTVSANTVSRKVGALALVLDRSGSMNESRGDSQSKYQSLKEAATILVDVMMEGDALGIVRFNQDAQKLQDVLTLGPAADPFDTTRTNIKNLINGPELAPSGETSIGDGIFEGRQILNSVAGTFDVKAMVVLTDGKENRSRMIADVSNQINERTYSIGLGKPENISVPALQTISGNNGGYLLVTGPISGDNRFILQKYFLQILAGINNAAIVLDPSGELVPGHEQVVPFSLTEADNGIDVVLLTPNTKEVNFVVQTPNGFLIDPSRAAADSTMLYVLSEGVSYYRIALPTEIFPARFDRAGTWRIRLRIGKPKPVDTPPLMSTTGNKALTSNEEQTGAVFKQGATNKRGIPYSVMVTSHSGLQGRPTVQQTTFEPGAVVSLFMTLTENGMPSLPGGYVFAEILRPDESRENVVLQEENQGEFRGRFQTTIPGVYQCRIRGTGRSRAGYPFHREQTLSISVWKGGDLDAQQSQSGLKEEAWQSFLKWVNNINKKQLVVWLWAVLILLFLLVLFLFIFLLRG